MSTSDFDIYNNVLVFAKKYRRYEVTSTEIDNERKYISEMESKEYILIECKINGNSTYIFIFNVKSKFISKSNNFELIEHFIKYNKKQPVDIIIITKDHVNAHIKKKIIAMKKKNIVIHNYIYDNFVQIIPEAKNEVIPEHTVISDQIEIDKVIDDLKIKKIDQLPKIPLHDPAVIWAGGASGDLIKIIGPSESAGFRIAYRVVL